MQQTSTTFCILVTAAPTSQGALSALQFCQAAVVKNHTINRVFFYGDASLIASALQVIPQDELALATKWCEFAKQYNITLQTCVATSLRRGIVDNNEATRHALMSSNTLPEIEIAGLGQLFIAMQQADRFLQFH